MDGRRNYGCLPAACNSAGVAARSAPTPVETGADGRHAFPADVVRDTAESLIASLAAASPDDPVDTIVCACLGTAMVPVDRAGRPLGAALSPADARPSLVPGLRDQAI